MTKPKYKAKTPFVSKAALFEDFFEAPRPPSRPDYAYCIHCLGDLTQPRALVYFREHHADGSVRSGYRCCSKNTSGARVPGDHDLGLFAA